MSTTRLLKVLKQGHYTNIFELQNFYRCQKQDKLGLEVKRVEARRLIRAIFWLIVQSFDKMRLN